MRLTTQLALTVLLLAFGTSQLSAGSITTLFGADNSGGSNSSQTFDLSVLNGAGITITSIAVNDRDNGQIGSNFIVNLYTTPATAAGKETNAAAWTLVASGPGVGAAQDTPIPVSVTPFFLAAGTYGFAVSSPNQNLGYTGGTNTYSNADVSLTNFHSSVGCLFCGVVNVRTWNGTINYTVGNVAVPEPATLPLSGLLLTTLVWWRSRNRS